MRQRVLEGGVMTHVSMLKIDPHSSLEEPWRFETLSDAMLFSQLIHRPLFAAVVGDDCRYQIFPGGRVYEYREPVWAGMLGRKKRAREHRKKPISGLAPDGTRLSD